MQRAASTAAAAPDTTPATIARGLRAHSRRLHGACGLWAHACALLHTCFTVRPLEAANCLSHSSTFCEAWQWHRLRKNRARSTNPNTGMQRAPLKQPSPPAACSPAQPHLLMLAGPRDAGELSKEAPQRRRLQALNYCPVVLQAWQVHGGGTGGAVHSPGDAGDAGQGPGKGTPRKEPKQPLPACCCSCTDDARWRCAAQSQSSRREAGAHLLCLGRPRAPTRAHAHARPRTP